MSESQETNKGNEFTLERYKFILQEIHFLNGNIHKYLALFQTLATAVIGGGTAIFVSWQKLSITAEVAKMGIYGLLGLLILLALFVILLIFSGIFSWIDYRNEEANLLDETVRKDFRSRPELKNLWRWYETWIIIFIIVFVLIVCFFTEIKIIPLIQ